MFWEAKQVLKRALESTGYSIVRSKTGSLHHERVYPHATYAPWSLDTEFLSAYNAVRSHTLVDKYRCWELWSLVAQTRRLSGDCIEIGVWRGGTGCLIAKRVQSLGIVCEVFLCDTFSGVVKAGPLDDAYRGAEHADTSEKHVRELADQIGVQVRLLRGVFPEKTGAQVIDRRFRFCHIDVDVYQSACDCIDWLWPRLMPGGVAVFDDYGFQGCDGVRRLVEEWSSRCSCTFLHNLNGHAILVKS